MMEERPRGGGPRVGGGGGPRVGGVEKKSYSMLSMNFFVFR